MVVICPDGLRGAEATTVMCIPVGLYGTRERQSLVRVSGAHRLLHHTPGTIIEATVQAPTDQASRLKPITSLARIGRNALARDRRVSRAQGKTRPKRCGRERPGAGTP